MNQNPNTVQSENQVSKILEYMRHGNKITPLEALNLFGCMRLQARIFDIKELGHKVCKSFVSLDNGKKVMSYWLDINELN
jgi:hypothetical protein